MSGWKLKFIFTKTIFPSLFQQLIQSIIPFIYTDINLLSKVLAKKILIMKQRNQHQQQQQLKKVMASAC